MSGREKKIDIGSVLTFNTVFSYLKVLPLLFFSHFRYLKERMILGRFWFSQFAFFIFQSNTSILCGFVLNSSAKQFKMFNFRFNIAFVTNIGFKSSTYSPQTLQFNLRNIPQNTKIQKMWQRKNNSLENMPSAQKCHLWKKTFNDKSYNLYDANR